MKNISSYQLGTCFTGKEINDFIRYHIENKTSHRKMATRLMNHFIFKDEGIYKSYSGCMSDHNPHGIMFLRVR